MRFDFQPTYFLMALANAAVLGGAVTWFSQLSFWITWPLVIAAMFINGRSAEWEDHQRGGFYNP